MSTDCKFSALFILAFVVPIVGCSGMKAGSGSPTSTSPQQISIQLNQTSVTLAAGATQQFTAFVNGTNNTAVTWSVDNVNGGNPTVGAITSAGLYTAPNSAGTHIVTATSVADTTKSASATVTVT